MAKVIFIQKKQLMQQEYIGVMQISAYLKLHNHSCDLILGDNKDEIINEVIQYKPDIIAFSVMTIDSKWVLEIASNIKKIGIPGIVIAGGPHPTYFPDFINNDCIDIICIGEGETSILELVNAVDKGESYTNIKNLHVKKDGEIFKNPIRPLMDIDSLPYPDREIYLKYPIYQNQRNYNFNVSSGCHYDCSFCFIHQWKNLYSFEDKRKLVRLKRIDRAIDEIVEFSKRCKVSLITFADSTFNLDKKWTIDFLEEYKKRIDIPFTLNIRANLVDEDIVKAIAKTNLCHSVRMGIEVGDEEIRKKVLRKNITDAQIYRTAELLKKYKIKLVAYMMFGLPGETLKDAYETIKMCRKIKPFSFSCQIFHPYPGLNITEYAVQKGYLKADNILKLAEADYKIFNSILEQNEIKEVTNLYKFSVLAIKLPFLSPLIKLLIRCNPNPIFDFIYAFSSYFMLRKYTVLPLGK